MSRATLISPYSSHFRMNLRSYMTCAVLVPPKSTTARSTCLVTKLRFCSEFRITCLHAIGLCKSNQGVNCGFMDQKIDVLNNSYSSYFEVEGYAELSIEGNILPKHSAYNIWKKIFWRKVYSSQKETLHKH